MFFTFILKKTMPKGRLLSLLKDMVGACNCQIYEKSRDFLAYFQSDESSFIIYQRISTLSRDNHLMLEESMNYLVKKEK